MNADEPVLHTSQLENHFVITQEVNQQGRRYSRNVTQTPIDYYFNTGSLVQHQWEAGQRFFSDAKRSAVLSGSTSFLNPDRIAGAGVPDMSETQLHALKRWREAQESIRSLIGRHMAINVCCYGYMLKDLRHPYFRKSSEMMPMLKEALDNLAWFYGIPKYPPLKKNKGRIKNK